MSSNRKGRKPFVPDIPEDLPQSARPFWPDLSTWPDMQRVQWIVRKTRRRSQTRLDVLTGLRRFAAGDANLMLALVSFMLAVIAICLTLAAGEGLMTAILSVLAAGGIIALFRLVGHVASLDERRRSAGAWLAAIESEIERC